jgi:hypothetical protein
MANGDWLLFLGADDYIWGNDVVAKASPYLRESRAALAFGEVCIVAACDDTVVQIVKFNKAQLLAQLRGPKGLGLPHQGFFHNRRAFDTGPFDPTLRLAADYEFISRFSAERDFCFLPIGPVAAFRMGGLSTDPWVSLETYREWRRIHHARGRSAMHGWWQLMKAHIKVLLKNLLGAAVARRFINLSRAPRGLPPYQD